MFGPPVLFVHGSWHGAWCWERWADAVAKEGHPAYVINLPGHERQGSRARIWPSLNNYVRVVEAALNQIGSDCVVVGHSLGGLVGQKVNERRALALLILVGSVPLNGVLSATAKFAVCHPLAILKVAATANTWPIMDDPYKAADVLYAPSVPMDDVVENHARLCNESFRVFLDMFVRFPRPRRARGPVRVMAGELDELFPLKGQIKLANAYGVEPFIVRGTGHSIMLEPSWREALDVIMDWIRELMPGVTSIEGVGAGDRQSGDW